MGELTLEKPLLREMNLLAEVLLLDAPHGREELADLHVPRPQLHLFEGFEFRDSGALGIVLPS